MNSFRFLQRGLESEIERQIDTLETGGRVVQETVHFDPNTGRVSSLRSKEEAHDYRYFPEPDLPPIELDAEYVDKVRASLPELPAARKERIIEQYGVTAKEAALLAANKPLGDYFETLAGLTGRPAGVGQLGAGRSVRVSEHVGAGGGGLPGAAGGPRRVARPAQGRHAFGQDGQGSLRGHVARAGRRPGSSWRRRAWARYPTRALWRPSWPASWQANPGPAEEFRQGRDKVLGFFVGQIMKETKGQANPQVVNDLLRKLLQKG